MRLHSVSVMMSLGRNDLSCLFILCRVADIVDGKGAGKAGRFQGKANKLSQKHKVEALIKDHLGITS